MNETTASLLPVLIFILILLLAFAAAFGAWKLRHPLARIPLAIIAAALVLIHAWLGIYAVAPHWVDSRFRVYKAFYDEIQPGMTREQVLSIMEKHYPADGPRQRPKVNHDTAGKLSFFMNPEHTRQPDSEAVILNFADGRVTRKLYSRD